MNIKPWTTVKVDWLERVKWKPIEAR
jgi:hypothetical protein